MIRELKFKPDFWKAIERFEAWWLGEIVDRPPVTLSVLPRRKYAGPISTHRTLRERWMDAEFQVAQSIAWMEQQDWVGDRFPAFVPNLGPELSATLFGCELEFGEDTSWSRPIIHDTSEWQRFIETPPNFQNVYWQTIERMMDLAIERCDGRYVVGITDLHGNIGIVAAARGPQKLCEDLMDCPELVARAVPHAAEAFVECFERSYAKVSAAGFGSTTWLPCYHEGKFYPPSCDFWCMVSPQIAREMIFPHIVTEMKPLARSIFHLDGPQALKHFDLMMELPNLNAVQWVYGDGHGTASAWIDVYRRIQERGKSMQVLARDAEDALTVLKALKPEGVMLSVGESFPSIEAANAFLKEVGRISASRLKKHFQSNGGTGVLPVHSEKRAGVTPTPPSVLPRTVSKMKRSGMTPRERILTAARRGKPDRVPLDIWYTGEVKDRLLKHFGVTKDVELWAKLHLDKIVSVGPRYVGPPARLLPDGTKVVPPWWVRTRDIHYGTGTYTESVEAPLANATTLAEFEQHQWPSADWYDFSTIAEQCDAWPEHAIEGCYVAPFFWHNHVRGLEQSCMDLIAEPELTEYALRRITEFCWEYATRFFEAAKGKIHITQVTDDYGSQHGLLISEECYRKWFKPIQKKFIDLGHSAGALVMHHDDGAIRPIIPDLVELGVDILNPIQHVCPGMGMAGLKKDFGDKLCFHGGVDNQDVLPHGSVEDVRREVRDCIRTLGAGGGYILAPCHNIQPVTPTENIIAMYETAWTEGWY